MNEYRFFAEKKATPFAHFIAEQMHKKLFRLFRKKIPQDGVSILEIGPGLGNFTKWITTVPGMSYTGYEPESVLCKRLQEKGLKVVNQRIPPTQETDESQDVVVMLNVLEHFLGLTQAQEMAAELYRILKKNGVAFLTFPNYMDWKRDFFNLDYTHCFHTTEVSASQLFLDAGFSIEFIGHHNGCFFSDFGRIPNMLAHWARAFLMTVLPRSIGRKEKIQKMGVLFSENIILVARKKM